MAALVSLLWHFFIINFVVILNAQNNVVSLTEAQKKAMLDKHNQYRKDCANGVYTINGPQYASNMVYFFWDKGLEDMAKKRASYCYFGHFGGSQGIADDWDQNKENITFFEPNSGYTVGENVAVYPQNPPVTNYPEEIFTSGIDGWAEEGEVYDWAQNICYADTCGHWGQVCSGPTRYVGCAFVECYDGIAGATLDIYKNGGMLLVCNYYPGVNQGAYPYEDGLTFDFCIRCQQWDVKICEENVCKGGKARDWLASGLINSTIDQCTDGLGRIMDPCTTIDPTKAPSQGLSSSPTKVTDSPVTRSPTTSKQPTPRPTLFGVTPEPTSVAPPTTKEPSRSPMKQPTDNPSKQATPSPVKSPTPSPIKSPTRSPVKNPTRSPFKEPTRSPFKDPTRSPIKDPTRSPIKDPTRSPIKQPTRSPNKSPTHGPTVKPTTRPTFTPSKKPSIAPSKSPSSIPSKSPTTKPTGYPSKRGDTAYPTLNPSFPTISPSVTPTKSTSDPSKTPTETPSKKPTETPTELPTKNPIKAPTNNPSKPGDTAYPTLNPSNPTTIPSITPTQSTLIPSNTPTNEGKTNNPTLNPSITISRNVTDSDTSGNAQKKSSPMSIQMIIIICGIIVLIGIIICIIYVLIKSKKMKKETQKTNETTDDLVMSQLPPNITPVIQKERSHSSYSPVDGADDGGIYNTMNDTAPYNDLPKVSSNKVDFINTNENKNKNKKKRKKFGFSLKKPAQLQHVKSGSIGTSTSNLNIPNNGIQSNIQPENSTSGLPKITMDYSDDDGYGVNETNDYNDDNGYAMPDTNVDELYNDNTNPFTDNFDDNFNDTNYNDAQPKPPPVPIQAIQQTKANNNTNNNNNNKPPPPKRKRPPPPKKAKSKKKNTKKNKLSSKIAMFENK